MFTNIYKNIFFLVYIKCQEEEDIHLLVYLLLNQEVQVLPTKQEKIL